MKKSIGLWIDHRKAVIVIVSKEGEEVKEITSHMEKHVRFSDAAAEGGQGEDVRDRQFTNHLNSYYDTVISHDPRRRLNTDIWPRRSKRRAGKTP